MASVHGETMYIEIRDLTVKYKDITALENIDLKIEGPGLIQVLGPNGAGKSTLLRSIAGLVKPQKGCICINGKDTTANPQLAGRSIGYVAQRPEVSKYSTITVREFLCYSYMIRRQRWPRPPCREIPHNIEPIIHEDILDRKLTELSGGQLMKTYIARSLMYAPSILLLDEPLGPMDPASKLEFADIISMLSKERLVLVTSHDPIILLEYTDKILLLNKRVIAYGRPSEVLLEEVLSRAYGRGFREVEYHIHLFDSHY